MKKILSLMLIISLMICALIPAASAETINGLTLDRKLIRAYGDGYEYFTYAPATFDTTGIIAQHEVDLDLDGASELVSVELTADNLVYLVVYESVNGAWSEADFSLLFTASFTCNVQANDVFLRQVGDTWYIFNENWHQENCMADGAAWAFRAYTYDGAALASHADFYVDGTDVYGDLNAWTTDAYLTEDRPELQQYAQQLKEYGFIIDGVYWGNMIMEQDTTLTALARIMSVQDIPYPAVSDFTSANGSELEGFRTFIIDCSLTANHLQSEYYLSNNQAANEYEAPEAPAADTAETDAAGEYIIADSDVRALTAEELSAYDKDTLALIRNEILARYGYPFQKQMYRDYFGSKSWYTRNENFNYSMLTSLEMENIELIKKLEAK